MATISIIETNVTRDCLGKFILPDSAESVVLISMFSRYKPSLYLGKPWHLYYTVFSELNAVAEDIPTLKKLLKPYYDNRLGIGIVLHLPPSPKATDEE